MPADSTASTVLTLWGEAGADHGTEAQRRSHIDALEPIAGLHLGTGGIYCGAADCLRAMLLDRLGEHDAADALFAEAVRQHEDFRSPRWVARTQLDWAESLLRRDSPDAARHHLDAAATTLGDLDLPTTSSASLNSAPSSASG